MIQTKSSIKSTLFSPINGSISYINSIPSKPNEKILQINSDERIIRANISESELNLLKINQNISVTSSDHTQFTSKIKEISNIPSKIKNGYINITKGLLIDEKVVKNPTSKLINIYI